MVTTVDRSEILALLATWDVSRTRGKWDVHAWPQLQLQTENKR